MTAGSYTLPAHIAAKIEAVHGLHGVPLPTRKRERRTSDAPPETLPSVLVETYGIHAKASGSRKVRQAVAEFQGEYMNKSDLSTFFKAEVYGWSRGDDRVSKFVGAPYARHAKAGLEAMLDIEYLMGVATGVK